MICSNEKSMRVEQFAKTGVECHEILDTKSSFDCGGVAQIISLYSADRKHLPFK